MNYDRADLLDRLAAEYVLGSMSARVRARFNSIQRTLPAARDAVYAWEERLMPLARSIPPAQPSAATWKAIERKIGGGASRSSAARWLGWLKPLLGMAFGVIATLGLIRLYPTVILPVDNFIQERGILPASYVGLLTDEANNPVVLASSTRHGRIMSIKMLRKVDVPANKVLQLWALPQDGLPFPLGVVPAEGKSTFQMTDTSQNLLSRVSKLAVSIEDGPARAGATPAPFVLTGHCVKLW